MAKCRSAIEDVLGKGQVAEAELLLAIRRANYDPQVALSILLEGPAAPALPPSPVTVRATPVKPASQSAAPSAASKAPPKGKV